MNLATSQGLRDLPRPDLQRIVDGLNALPKRFGSLSWLSRPSSAFLARPSDLDGAAK